MLKVMEVVTALKSSEGYRLQVGAQEPQVEDLKKRLTPLLAIQASYDCQRILGLEGPKYIS